MDKIRQAYNLPSPEYFKNLVNSGIISPLEYMVRVKELSAYVEQLLDDGIKQMAINEADQKSPSPGKIFEAYGAKLQVKLSGVRYDYSACGDKVYNKLKSDLKEREDILKALPSNGADIDGAHIMPPVKTGTRSLTVSLLNE